MIRKLDPFTLDVAFQGNTASIATEGSNMHVGNDQDFYRIVLETGFNYSVSARVHDSYNSGNQLTYTNDVIWSYHTGEDWSEVYDDVMPGSFTFREAVNCCLELHLTMKGKQGPTCWRSR
jgi:hypothetical protein